MLGPLVLVVLIGLINYSQQSWNISRNGYLQAPVNQSYPRMRDVYSVTFWTNHHNGILLYGVSKNEFLLVELYSSSIRVAANFASMKVEEPVEGFVGSSLSDTKIHQIEIYISSNSLMLVLDRGLNTSLVAFPVIGKNTHGVKFEQIYLGGFKDASRLSPLISLSRTGFNGCIEEARWNAVNLLKKAKIIHSHINCQKRELRPMSFLDGGSYIRLYRDNYASGLKLSFDILTSQHTTTLFYHKDKFSTLEVSIYKGSFLMTLNFGTVNYINAFLPMVRISDGDWHHITIQLPGDRDPTLPNVIFGVDNEIVITNSSFTYDVARDLKFGGHGFVGCINNLIVDGKLWVFNPSVEHHNMTLNGCFFPNRCLPNPCKHSSICENTRDSFSCKCPPNYSGDVCDDPVYSKTCAHMYAIERKNPGKQNIDLDGPGQLEPKEVTCSYMHALNQNDVVTQIPNLIQNGKVFINNEPTTVDISYALNLKELRLLILNSDTCYQQVTYECSKSRIVDGNTTLLVWMGGDGIVHDYWNSAEVYAACECFYQNQICANKNRCNCDANDRVTRSDSVTFKNKYHLPIMKVIAMDISSSTGKRATLDIGPLVCVGIDRGTKNALTFQEVYSYFPIYSFNFASYGIIEFEFATDHTNGNIVLFSQSTPKTEYFLLELTNSSVVTVRFTSGANNYVISCNVNTTNAQLNDLKYHSVKFKLNKKSATLQVDKSSSEVPLLYDYKAPIVVNRDHTPFYLGGSPFNMYSGYRGTIRKLYINGVLLDLPALLKNSGYFYKGIYPGPYSSCLDSSNPCNYGKCVEHFNYYTCDCSTSPFDGKRCEKEVAVTFYSSSTPISYKLSAIGEVVSFSASVGFSTSKGGLLFLITRGDSFVFIDVFQHALRLCFDIYPQAGLFPKTYEFYHPRPPNRITNGDHHVVRLIFSKDHFRLYLNDTEHVIYIRSSTESAKLIDSSAVIHIGNAPPIKGLSTSASFGKFEGCLGGMKVALHYQNGTKRVMNILNDTQGVSTSKDSGVCFGKLPVSPNPPLLPLPPNFRPGSIGGVSWDRLTQRQKFFLRHWLPVLIAIVIIILFMLLLLILLTFRWYSRNRGTYTTEEDSPRNKAYEKINLSTFERPSHALPHANEDNINDWFI